MKKVRLFILFLGVILVVCGIVFQFIPFKEKENSVEWIELVKINLDKETYISCSQEEKQLKKKTDSTTISYQYISRYEFSVSQGKIIWGNLFGDYIFDTLDDYNNYLNVVPSSDEDIKIINDKTNLTVTSQRYAVVYTSSMDYNDSYLEILKENGYTCKITSES